MAQPLIEIPKAEVGRSVKIASRTMLPASPGPAEAGASSTASGTSAGSGMWTSQFLAADSRDTVTRWSPGRSPHKR